MLMVVLLMSRLYCSLCIKSIFLQHVKNLMMGLLKENILKKINIYLLKLRTLVTIGRYTQLFDGL